MSLNGNQKGKAGERELAALFRTHGFAARRGQQFSGGGESPDVVHDIPGVHVECKRTERFAMWDALTQANKDKRDGDTAVVFHRMNNKPWVVVLGAKEFLEIMAELCPIEGPTDAK